MSRIVNNFLITPTPPFIFRAYLIQHEGEGLLMCVYVRIYGLACLCAEIFVCLSRLCWTLSAIFPLEEERITPRILSLRPSESYNCHSVAFPIHNWGVCTAQSPWNHVNHFQLLLLNNQAEPTVPGGWCACAAACITDVCSQSST